MKNLETFIKDVSLQKLNQYFNQKIVSIKTPSAEFPIYGKWMSLILLSGPVLRITLKIQYNTQDISKLAPHLFRVQGTTSSDVVNEYCGMVASLVRSELNRKGLQLGMSLPVATRSFDELFMETQGGDTVFEARWTLGNDQGSLTCLSVTQVFSLKELPSFDGLKISESDSTGEVEIL